MKVHFIAIGGSAMHNLALALHQNGYQVTGSDDEIFEPSKSRLSNAGLLPSKEGWQTDNITPDLDAVILGMHARKDNPELLKATEMKLPIYSYPEFLYQQSKNKTRVVIAGSHGKTTISAMILHVLGFHDMDTDFMIGAQLEGFDTMVKITPENEFMLLEGDEYLSSPTDLRPKFIHYRPNITLISGIAWDHVNVFPTFDDYKEQFSKLLDVVEPGGVVIYNQTDEAVAQLVEQHTAELKKFPYTLPDYSINNGESFLHTPEGDVPLQIIGKHNMNNLEGARLICNQMGVTDDQFYEAMASFSGAARRLQVLKEEGQFIAYRDFAHAPSKVTATTQAVKESFESRKLIACLELHTFSSLNKDFITQYKGALDAADEALVYFSPEVVAHKRLPELSENDVRHAFGNPKHLKVFTDTQQLIDNLQKITPAQNANLLIMSSGNFHGVNWEAVTENILKG